MRGILKGIGALGMLVALWGCAPIGAEEPGSDTAGSAIARAAGPEDPRPQPRPGTTRPQAEPAAVATLEPPAPLRTPDAADDLMAQPAGQPADAEEAASQAKPEPKLPDSLIVRPGPPPVPVALRAQAAQCARDKGNFVRRGGTGAYVCVRTTRDANQSCSDSSDCEGICFAKSRTCAPADPLFGCYDALEDGRVVNLCVQ